MTINGTRRYQIKSHGCEFVTRVLPDGNQILVVPIGARKVAQLNFSPVGDLLSTEDRVGELADDIEELDDDTYSDTISVLAFSVPKYGIEIRSEPDSFKEFRANPEKVEPDPKYRERTHYKIFEWEQKGRFVLEMPGNDYWMDPDGSVYAT